jgi:hypothetical protein
MRLIKLTELKRDTDDSVIEKDILINPEGIATVEEMKMPHEAIPILGQNHSGRLARGITMRSGQRMMVKESLGEISAICEGQRGQTLPDTPKTSVEVRLVP